MFERIKPLVYIQISAERLRIRNLQSGAVISEVPEMALDGSSKPRVLAVGPEARIAAANSGAQLVNPFAHPRSLISDFDAAEAILRVYMRRALTRPFWLLAPTIILHPLGSPEGGFTQVELRAFRELGLALGGSAAFVWTGEELSDDEIRAGRYRLSDQERGL